VLNSLALVLPDVFNRIKIKHLAVMFANPKNWQFLVRTDVEHAMHLLYRQVKLISMSPVSKDNKPSKTAKLSKPGVNNPPANITERAKKYWPTFWLKRSKTDKRQRQYKNIILNSAKRVEKSGRRRFHSDNDRTKYVWAVAVIIFSRSCLKHRIPFVEHRRKNYRFDKKTELSKGLKGLSSVRDRRLFAQAISRLMTDFKKTRRFVLPRI
jgi:hypothetical protein